MHRINNNKDIQIADDNERGMHMEEVLQQVLLELKNVASRLDGIDNRFDNIDNHLAGIDNRLEAIDNRLTSVEVELKEVHRKTDIIYNQTANLTEFRTETNQNFTSLRRDMTAVEAVTAKNWSDIAHLKAIK